VIVASVGEADAARTRAGDVRCIRGATTSLVDAPIEDLSRELQQAVWLIIGDRLPRLARPQKRVGLSRSR